MANCNLSYATFGGAACAEDYGYDVSFYLTPLVANDGTVNKFDTVADVTAANINTKIALANTDPSKALYPLYLEFKNIEDERSEPVYEELTDTSQIFVRDGKRTPVAYFPRAHWELIRQLNTYKSTSFGVYMITNRRGFKYVTDPTKVEVLPINVQLQSLHASEVPGLPDTSDKVRITWTYDDAYKAADTRVITNDDLGFDPLNIAVVNELIESLNVLVSASTTQLVFNLKSIYGRAITGKTITEIASIENRTTGATVTPSAVNEAPAGTYTLDYTAPLVGELLSPIFLDTGYFTYEANKASIAVT